MGGEQQPKPMVPGTTPRSTISQLLPAEPSEGFESTIQVTSNQFPGQIEMLTGPEALAAAQYLSPRLAI